MSKDNKRCGCGSNLKYKNCCKNKKSRTLEIDLDASNAEGLEGFAFSDKRELLKIVNGQVTPFTGPTKIRCTYDRKNGKEKVITEGLVLDGQCFINPDFPILNFEHLIAVDTNTTMIDGEKVSIAAVAYSKQLDKTGEEVALSVPQLVSSYEYRNIEGNEERLVWKEIIEAMERADQYKAGKVALIVDSDLGNHSKYNQRELPIYDDFFLPERVTLLYGSADTGMEIMANRMIRFCDKRAAYIMNALKNGFDAGEDGKVEGRPYSHFRQWFPDHEHPDNRLHLRENELANIKQYSQN